MGNFSRMKYFARISRICVVKNCAISGIKSSFGRINYMAFMLSPTEVEKARAVGVHHFSASGIEVDHFLAKGRSIILQLGDLHGQSNLG